MSTETETPTAGHLGGSQQRGCGEKGGKNPSTDKSTAAGQLQLPHMPAPKFDRMGYSDAELARAKRDVEEFDRLVEQYPDLLGRAYSIASDHIDRYSHAGVRLVGELVRVWLADTYDATFSNGIISVLLRRIVSEHEWVRSFVHLKFCAVDAVLSMGGEDS